MGNLATLLTTMSERTTGLAEALAQGIEPKNAGTKPVIDGTSIDCNHPVFIYGHLAIYPQMIMQALGADPGSAAVPEQYSEWFKNGAECHDDPDTNIYPPFSEVYEHCMRAHKAVLEHVGACDDETLVGAIEGNEKAAEFFGTRQGMALFMLHDHFMFHLGQLSTWRRCVGLGSVM